MYSYFFSVIITTFNRAHTLRRSIESVINQDFIDFELIIIDDGSSDNTKDVVAEYRDNRIKYYYKENEERNIARNKGIQLARGKYICFLDSDDYLLEKHLKIFHKKFSEDESIDIVCSAFYYISSEGKKKYQINTEEGFPKYIFKGNPFSINSLCFKSEILKKHFFLNSKNAIIGEDHYLWVILATRYRFHFSEIFTSVIVNHGDRSLDNIDINKLVLGTEEIVMAWKKDEILMRDFKSQLNYAISIKYLLIATLASGDNKYHLISKKYLLKSIRLSLCILKKKSFYAIIKNLIFRYSIQNLIGL